MESNQQPADYKSAALPLSHTSVMYTLSRSATFLIITYQHRFVKIKFKINRFIQKIKWQHFINYLEVPSIYFSLTFMRSHLSKNSSECHNFNQHSEGKQVSYCLPYNRCFISVQTTQPQVVGMSGRVNAFCISVC